MTKPSSFLLALLLCILCSASLQQEVPTNAIALGIVSRTHTNLYSSTTGNVLLSQLLFQDCVYITNEYSSTDIYYEINAPTQLTITNSKSMTFGGLNGYVSKEDIIIITREQAKFQSSCPTFYTKNSRLIITTENNVPLYNKKCGKAPCTKDDIITELSIGTLMPTVTQQTSADVNIAGWEIVSVYVGNTTNVNTLPVTAYIPSTYITTFSEITTKKIPAFKRTVQDTQNWRDHEITNIGLTMLGWELLNGGRSSYNLLAVAKDATSIISGVDSSGLSNLLYLVVFSKRIPRFANDQYLASDSSIPVSGIHVGDLIFLSNSTSSSYINHVMIYLGINSETRDEYLLEALDTTRVITVKDKLGVQSIRDLGVQGNVLNGYKVYWGSYFERSIQDSRLIIEILLYVFIFGTIFIACSAIVIKHVFKRIKQQWKGRHAYRLTN
ncbi:hypothetical protein ABK040_007198 [Willaertia magna]